MSDVRARFGAALRERRVRQQLTQEELAERSGLSYKFIGEVERGKGNPTLTTMDRLARALGVGLGTLLEDSRSRPGSEVDYRGLRRDFQVIRETMASIEAVVKGDVVYPRKGRRQIK